MTEEEKKITETEADLQAPKAEDQPVSGSDDVVSAGPQVSEGGPDQAEPVEVLHPKELRRKRRSTHSGEVGQSRSVEQRSADRAAARERKAKLRRERRAKQGAKQTGSSTQKVIAASPSSTVSAERTTRPKVRQGVVVSDKADKTITVRIEDARRHKRYAKIIRRSSTLHAHDEHNTAKAGDTVKIVESRPLSRTKRWRLTEVLERAK